jgi:hypothetical protein
MNMGGGKKYPPPVLYAHKNLSSHSDTMPEKWIYIGFTEKRGNNEKRSINNARMA